MHVTLGNFFKILNEMVRYFPASFHESLKPAPGVGFVVLTTSALHVQDHCMAMSQRFLMVRSAARLNPITSFNPDHPSVMIFAGAASAINLYPYQPRRAAYLFIYHPLRCKGSKRYMCAGAPTCASTKYIATSPLFFAAICPR